MKYRLIFLPLLTFAVMLVAVALMQGKAQAGTCTINSSGLSIASYNVFTSTDQVIPEASGVLSVHCSGMSSSTATTIKIGMSGANSSTTYQNPVITMASYNLTYTLTVPGNSSLTWNLTNVYSTTATGNGGGNINFNVPAFNIDVVALQDVGVGTTYSGNVYFTFTCTGGSTC